MKKYIKIAAIIALICALVLCGTSCTLFPWSKQKQQPAPTITYYTVTFDLNGGDGTAPPPQTVESGNPITRPDDPVREGYIFNYWQAIGGIYSGIYNSFANAVYRDFTLRAQWISVDTVCRTITFEWDDGTVFYTETVADGGTVMGLNTTPTTNPTQAHYYFNGWLDKSTGEAYNFSSVITDDVILIPSWRYRCPQRSL